MVNEQLDKPSLRQIWKKIIVITMGSGAAQIIGFIFGIIIVRILSYEEYAIYKQGMLVVNMVVSFGAIISPISLGYFMARSKSRDEKKIYVFQTMYGSAIIGILIAILIYAFRQQVALTYNNQALAYFLPLFALLSFFILTENFFSYYMVSENRTKTLAIITVIFSLVRFLGLLVSILIKDDFFKIFMVMYVGVEALNVIYIFMSVNRNFKGIKSRITLKSIKEQIVFSVPLYISSIVSMLNANIGKNIVAMLYTPMRYSIYINGAYDIPFVSSLSSSIVTVMLPTMAAEYDKDNEIVKKNIININRRMLITIGCLFIPLYTTILIFAPTIIKVLFSDKYLESVQLFRIYSINVVLNSFSLGLLLTVAKEQKKIIYANVFMTILNLVLTLGIHYTIGFSYLTLAPIIATVIQNIILIYFTQRHYKQKNIFPLLDWIIIALVASVVSFSFGQMSAMFGSQTLGSIVMASASYVISIVAVKVIANKKKHS
ncbi:MAG: hypothetical protein CVV03_08015 [Firmicutes bacterium HGW-Firmicutes-8]|nr:MAG: hypothetical protein CVV03_08015 [Firmicutes bacterium HGW-Firmicutes-8]